MNERTAQTTDQATELILSLVEKHKSFIKRYIARRSGPEIRKKASVDDIFQETVVAASKGALGYQHIGDQAFLQWIMTIARRVIHKLMTKNQGQVLCRRIKGGDSTGIGVSVNEILSPIRTPSSLVASDEKSRNLMMAIQKLPPIHRRAITLYKLRQLTFAEVGQKIKRSEGQTSRIVAEALELLRVRLRSNEYE